jgi:hypothetical protein
MGCRSVAKGEAGELSKVAGGEHTFKSSCLFLIMSLLRHKHYTRGYTVTGTVGPICSQNKQSSSQMLYYVL